MTRLRLGFALCACVALCVLSLPVTPAADAPQTGDAAVKNNDDAAKRLAILFLGDRGHHEPAKRAASITSVLQMRGIDVTYTDDVKQLNKDNLAKYDGVLIYRDSGELPAENETALVEYLESGKGVIPLHCASHTFRNSRKYTELVGGRFWKHETGVFRARIVDAQHPAMRGVKSFETWDETYMHNELGRDIRVLMCRARDDGGYEPWTWVREQGKGRVYYTASGHDDRTWRDPGFHQLLESGIRWACGVLNDDLPPTAFQDAAEGLPNYVAGERWGTEADRVMKMPKPLDPAASMKHMHVPEGFRVELFAAEPDIVKPIAMNFDHRGRLWVIESVDYPNRLLRDPHENGNDQIKICEDTDGDGKADKFTVFCDKLNIPTSILPYKDGALVVLAPYILHLRDTDGDGKCDKREIVISGFGRGDTHAVASNLHYGLDNWIWAVCGYSGGRARQGEDGKTLSQRFGQCVFRFKPDGSAFEVITPTSNNTWGLGISENGDVFASTANNQHSVYVALPNRLYENVRGWHGVGSAGIADHDKFHPITPDVRQMDHHGKFTAASGHELYTARQFPEEYWNRAAFVCEPTGHLIHLNWLVPQGSGFVSRDGYNFFASTDPWTSPVVAQVGPDGALWISDWYNYIIQHNPTPRGFRTGQGAAYETTLRDKKHGRIYRVVYGDAKPSTKTLADATAKELVAALSDDNLFWRLQAQRLLVERGSGASPDDVLAAFPETLLRDPAIPAQSAHAASVALSLGNGGADKGPIGDTFLDANAATRTVLLDMLPAVENVLQGICNSRVLFDEHPRVRRAALLAIARMPVHKDLNTDLVSGQLCELFERRLLTDRWLVDAATAAASRHSTAFLSAAAKQKPGEDVAEVFVPLVRVVAEHEARGGDIDSLKSIVAALQTATPSVAEATIAGFSKGWPSDRKVEITPPLADSLTTVLAKVSPASQLELVALANRWGASERFAELTKRLTETLAKQVADDEVSDELRVQSAKQLIATGDAAALDGVLAAITPRSSPELAGGLLDALAEGKSDAIGAAIVARIGEFSPSARRAALAVLLRRKPWSMALLDAVEAKKLALDELALDQRQQLASHPDKELAERAAKLLASGGGLPNPDRQKVIDKFADVLKQTGDATAGKKLFVDNCAKCHKHGGEGATIGPDLTGMAAHPKSETIIHILDPNRNVEGNFRQHQVVTLDGEVLSGLLAGETRTAVELVDSEAKRHVVLREDIDQMKASQMSLMPEGFEKLGEAGVRDLLEFLAARGKYFPLPLAKAANVVSTRGGMFQGERLDYEKLVFSTWGQQVANGIPFQIIDPLGDRVPNAIVLYGPRHAVTRQYPKSVVAPCNAKAKAIHLLSGVSGWGFPYDRRETVSMIVRLHYADGQTEDHELVNGKHFADFSGATDVDESKRAFRLRGQQIRHVTISPKRDEVISQVEFIKGDDQTAPVVMAVTVEGP
ncbi:MAG: glycosyl hydrolase [Planctomycetota bacterium]|nr:MAG: glycosyl hydrolase [Planctomycetota bacterium]